MWAKEQFQVFIIIIEFHILNMGVHELVSKKIASQLRTGVQRGDCGFDFMRRSMIAQIIS